MCMHAAISYYFTSDRWYPPPPPALLFYKWGVDVGKWNFKSSSKLFLRHRIVKQNVFACRFVTKYLYLSKQHSLTYGNQSLKYLIERFWNNYDQYWTTAQCLLVIPSSTMSCILQHDDMILELNWSTTRTWRIITQLWFVCFIYKKDRNIFKSQRKQISSSENTRLTFHSPGFCKARITSCIIPTQHTEI